jgi:hypothetical protein
MKHLKTPQELNESSENLNISDVRSSKLSKDEIDSLVIKNRIRNLTIGF